MAHVLMTVLVPFCDQTYHFTCFTFVWNVFPTFQWSYVGFLLKISMFNLFFESHLWTFCARALFGFECEWKRHYKSVYSSIMLTSPHFWFKINSDISKVFSNWAYIWTKSPALIRVNWLIWQIVSLHLFCQYLSCSSHGTVSMDSCFHQPPVKTRFDPGQNL